MAEKHYIVGGTDGWLNIKREPSGQVIAVPEYLQAEITSSKDSRDYFTLLEGVELGKNFSVKAGNLKSGNPGYRGPANLTFTLKKGMLIYPGGKVNAITGAGARDNDKPIPPGRYPIQIPDFPHPKGMRYMAKSPYAQNWFFLGHGNAMRGDNGNDRYLHTGTESLGCITVEPSGWTRLYQYLILCRRGDGKTVGTVAVEK